MTHEFKRGDWVEVSDDLNFWYKNIFIAKIDDLYPKSVACISKEKENIYLSGNIPITHHDLSFFKHIRPIQQENKKVLYPFNIGKNGLGIWTLSHFLSNDLGSKPVRVVLKNVYQDVDTISADLYFEVEE